VTLRDQEHDRGVARHSDRWEAHPVLAWWVRVAVLLVPLIVSLVVAVLVVALLPRPHVLSTRVLWWVAVVGASFASAQLVERYARRALPLAVLLELSLVFPDHAPSRLKTVRHTSLREIERQVAEMREDDAGDPAEAARKLVALVGALGMHDKRTRGHSERVRAYVDMLTEELKLPEEARVRLRWAALLHDIGKLAVPGSVLNGGRELAADEWEALRRHPLEGEKLAGALLPWLGEWGTCVREHHERWDGSGYPYGLKGTQISLGARIVAVADAYEVMTSNRSYQRSVSAAAAREELARCAGTDFDPMVVRAFLAISIGRLRGVLGPLGVLPALPVAAAADKVGQAARGMTTVAAVSAVAVTAAGSPTAPVRPQPGPPPVVVAEPEAPVALPTPTPTPVATPTATAAPRAAAASAVPRPSARRVSVAPPPPAPAPSPLPGVLFLSGSGLVTSAPGAGTHALPQSGAALRLDAAVEAARALDGRPTLVLFHQLRPRHGGGLPKASVAVALQDCDGTTCRTLASTTTVLVRKHRGWSTQRVALPAVHTTLAPGHTLRLVLSLRAHANVTAVVLGYGGSTASRLRLP
jgi:HD-GYP domain-containing protein (c-di-GMP phosphodiesterase class II)